MLGSATSPPGRTRIRLDPRLPILVGLGEVTRRPGEYGDTEPAALMAEAVRAALADAGIGEGVLRHAVLGVVPSAAWPDGDPGRRVAELLMAELSTLRTSMQGGNGPQLLVNVLAARIQEGKLDTGVVCGAEALSTLARLMKSGDTPPWPDADPDRPAGEVLEEDRAAASEAELAVGMIAPIMAYPLIENALRIAAGRSATEHLHRISSLWARFSEVAVRQPAAWTPRAYDATSLATATSENRQVSLPYTKLLNANIQTDQGAAMLLCSVERARSLGIPSERWIFLHAGARASDEWHLSERRELHRSPAIRACGEAAFGHAGITADQLGPVDLYSCFPAAVQLAAQELGLPLEDRSRPLTETGGLTFFGGPGNNYATHGIIAVARCLRAAPEGTVGLSTALGWYATKHAIGLYGSSPPARTYRALEPELEKVAPRAVADPDRFEGSAETGTVIFGRDGVPAYGILFALLDDGRRALGKTDNPEVLTTLTDGGILGKRVFLHPDRTFYPQ